MEGLNTDTIFLKDLSERVAVILRERFDPTGSEFTKKADKTKVTKTDIEVNEFVIEEVKKGLPEYCVLGEEVSYKKDSSTKTVVVDPIDGTSMFALGIPLFCFSAAVVEDGVPTSAVICNPMSKRTLLAQKGKGTMLVESGELLKVKNIKEIKNGLFNCSWRDEASIPRRIIKEGAGLFMIRGICEAGSLVATGAFLGAFYTGKHAYDVAAVKLIVEEAGGKVTNIKGDEQRYDMDINGAVISNGAVHEEMLEWCKN